MKKVLSLIFATLSLSAVATEKWNAPNNANPFIPGYFADPTIRKFGDNYYLYATTDGTGNGYGPAQVWVSRDFKHWRNFVMNWPTTEVVWAPDVVKQKNGKYRYYYCEPCNVNVGESDSPVGPWHNILGKEDAVLVPDRYVHNVITLDPMLFEDEDGSQYLYFTTWGIYDGFGCGVAKLSDSDFDINSLPKDIRLDARGWNEVHPYSIAADKFFSEKRLIPNTELKDIFEAPFIFKRNGTYYFTYSSGSCHDATYRVQYATSTKGPMGPFTYRGEILTTNADETIHGPGHHSIIDINGKYYIVYHRHNNPKSVHGFNRQVCIDQLNFDDQGNILPVNPTHSGNGVDVIKETKCKDLAFGAKVTCSSYYDEWFKPEYAVDDNNGTLWKARHTNWDSPSSKRHDEWIQVDLGKVETFTEIWTQFEYPTFFYRYRIDISLDGKTWLTYADRTDNTMQGSPMIDRGKTKAQYIRLTITDTQKNGHMPAVWNIKVWKKAPFLPEINAETNDAYPGMHKLDVNDNERKQAKAVMTFDANKMAANAQKPFDIEKIEAGDVTFHANKPIRMRIKDGRWAMFFNGTQLLRSMQPVSSVYRYNAPYTINAWTLSTKVRPVSTITSLSSSHADLATTEFRLGSDAASGLINHNGSFESCGAPDIIKANEGKWTMWTVTYDGWMERVYCNGKLVREQNNFIMLRPEGNVTIGADGAGTNNFVGYIHSLSISPVSISEDDIKSMYESTSHSDLPSLGDDFEETDPNSRFVMPEKMDIVYEKQEPFTLAASTPDFNLAPIGNGGYIYKEVEGDFVVMATVDDIDGLAERKIKGWNDGGILLESDSTYYQLGAFPLYNCGNMFTVLSKEGRPQYPNYTGYDFHRILQFERRGNLLFARTSADGKTWENMPGSPVEVKSPSMRIGAYQTTYSQNYSWIKLKDYRLYSY